MRLLRSSCLPWALRWVNERALSFGVVILGAALAVGLFLRTP